MTDFSYVVLRIHTLQLINAHLIKQYGGHLLYNSICMNDVSYLIKNLQIYGKMTAVLVDLGLCQCNGLHI